MRIRKMIMTAACCLCTAVFLTGCSMTDIFNHMIGEQTTEETDSTSVSTSSTQQDVDVKEVDASLEAPTFGADLTGTTRLTKGCTFSMACAATVTDGGKISYQWYKNNVNSNGGGTPIEGATEETYTVDTSEEGTTYYYVVATNTKGDKINKATSTIREVVVWPLGTWQQDETGYRYVMEDGTYPADCWIDIDNNTYHMDADGHRSTGWYQEGDYQYYFNEAGELQRNTTSPEGYSLNEHGVRVS